MASLGFLDIPDVEETPLVWSALTGAFCETPGQTGVKTVSPPALPESEMGAAVLPLETLLTGPGFDQGPIDCEVLVGHQALGPLDHAPEKLRAIS
jgi:hypothetical protein